MSLFHLRRLNPALIISVLALMIALGGTGYAAFSLPKNSVGTKQLKDGAVTSEKIKNGAVTGKQVKLSTLGTVPSASHALNADHAASAASAGNAHTVGGQTVTKLSLLIPANTPSRTIFSGDGLTLTASNTFDGKIGLTAQVSDPQSEFNFFGFDGGVNTASGSFHGEYDAPGANQITILPVGEHQASVTIEYADTSGHAVTATLGVDFASAFGSTGYQSGIWGTIVSG